MTTKFVFVNQLWFMWVLQSKSVGNEADSLS